MSRLALEHLTHAERLERGLAALLRRYHQVLGRYHRAVEPMDLAAAPDAADQADVGARDLGKNLGDEKLGQSERIGHRTQGFLGFHLRTLLPTRRASCPLSYDGHNLNLCSVSEHESSISQIEPTSNFGVSETITAQQFEDLNRRAT